MRFLGGFRTLFYLPSIMPVVVTTLTFKFIFDRDGGPINALLSLFRPGTAIAWLSNEWCTPALITLLVWGLGGRHDHLPCRPAGHTHGTQRSGGNRRGHDLAGVSAYHHPPD